MARTKAVITWGIAVTVLLVCACLVHPFFTLDPGSGKLANRFVIGLSFLLAWAVVFLGGITVGCASSLYNLILRRERTLLGTRSNRRFCLTGALFSTSVVLVVFNRFLGAF